MEALTYNTLNNNLYQIIVKICCVVCGVCVYVHLVQVKGMGTSPRPPPDLHNAE